MSAVDDSWVVPIDEPPRTCGDEGGSPLVFSDNSMNPQPTTDATTYNERIGKRHLNRCERTNPTKMGDVYIRENGNGRCDLRKNGRRIFVDNGFCVSKVLEL